MADNYSCQKALALLIPLVKNLSTHILDVAVAKNTPDELNVSMKLYNNIAICELRYTPEEALDPALKSGKVFIALKFLHASLGNKLQGMSKAILAAVISLDKPVKEKLSIIEKFKELPDSITPVVNTAKFLVAPSDIPSLSSDMTERNMVEALKVYQQLYTVDLDMVSQLTGAGSQHTQCDGVKEFITTFDQTFKAHAGKWIEYIDGVVKQLEDFRQVVVIVAILGHTSMSPDRHGKVLVWLAL